MKLLVPDSTGHATFTDEEMTDAEIRAKFDQITGPRSRGGLGMMATVGTLGADPMQVASYDEGVAEATKRGEDSILFIPQMVGG